MSENSFSLSSYIVICSGGWGPRCRQTENEAAAVESTWQRAYCVVPEKFAECSLQFAQATAIQGYPGFSAQRLFSKSLKEARTAGPSKDSSLGALYIPPSGPPFLFLHKFWKLHHPSSHPDLIPGCIYVARLHVGTVLE